MVRIIASALGLVALVAAIVVGAVAATGVLSDAPTSSGVGGSQASVEEETMLAEPAARVIDESVSAGKLEWNVAEARQVTELSSYTFPPTTLRGNFLIVTFSVENTSEGPVTLTEDSMALLDEEGVKDSPAASVNSEYVEPEKGILFNERGLLDPGETREGRVNFDLSVPFGVDPSADLSGFRLELGDGDPTVEEEELVDLRL